MEITDFARGKAWAIEPKQFEAIARKVQPLFAEFNSEKISDGLSEKISQFNRRNRDEENRRYSVEGGIATIPIVGPLTKRETFWSWFFGWPTYEGIGAAVREAVDDPAVKSILLDIDSPGGVVNGVEALSDTIYQARDEKPVFAYANGMMASAAYWIGSAAETIVGNRTSEVGSIGVLMVHYDFSRLDDRIGVKVTYLAAGKYKALGNDSEPLSQEAREVFQTELNQIYDVFTSTVARNRGVDIETVKNDMAEGRLFLGVEAQSAGLIDEIAPFDDAVALAESAADDNGPDRLFTIISSDDEPTIIQQGGLDMPTETKIQIDDINVAFIKKHLPDVAAALIDEGKSAVNIDEPVAEAVKNESGRILGLAEVQFGAEAGEKFRKVVETGATVDQYKAFKEMNPEAEKADDAKTAEDKKRDEMLAAVENAGAEDVGTGGDVKTAKDFQTLITEYRAAHKCNYQTAYLAIRKAHPEAFDAFMEKVN